MLAALAEGLCRILAIWGEWGKEGSPGGGRTLEQIQIRYQRSLLTKGFVKMRDGPNPSDPFRESLECSCLQTYNARKPPSCWGSGVWGGDPQDTSPWGLPAWAAWHLPSHRNEPPPSRWDHRGPRGPPGWLQDGGAGVGARGWPGLARAVHPSSSRGARSAQEELSKGRLVTGKTKTLCVSQGRSQAPPAPHNTPVRRAAPKRHRWWEWRGAMLVPGARADLLPTQGGMEKGCPAHLLEAALGDRDPGLDSDDRVRVAGGEDLLPQRGDALQLQLLALQGLHQLLREGMDRGTAGSQPPAPHCTPQRRRDQPPPSQVCRQQKDAERSEHSH